MSTMTPSNGRSQGRATVPGALPPSARGSAKARAAVPAASGTTRGPSGPGGPGAPPRGAPYRGGRPKPRWGRIALVSGLVILLLALLGGAGAWLYYEKIDASLNRDDPFSQVTGGRPAKVSSGAINLLMLGSDSRDPDHGGKPGEWRSDTMIIMHIPASHDKAYLISLPRDLYVDVPKSQSNPKLGGHKAKMNAAFAWGGTPLTIKTVEGFSGVRMDHVALIDFGGFKQVIDALGGIDMNVEQDVKSIHKPFRQFKKGMNHFGGEEALDYARQRYQFPDGDFARMRHQQQMMKAIMDKAASSGTLSNPVKLNSFLNAITSAMTVDKDFSLADMAVQFRGIRSEDLTFLVSPNLGAQTINGESVIVPDRTKGLALYDAVKHDKVAEWLAQASPAPSTKSSGSPKGSGSPKAGG